MKPLWWFALALLALATPAWGQVAFTASAEAVTQATPTVTGVWVDLPALLAGAEDHLTPDAIVAVVVRPADSPDAPPLPSRVEIIDGLHRVLWQTPKATADHPVGSRQPFRLEFWTQPPPTHTQLPSGTDANLVANGSFEELLPSGLPQHVALRDFEQHFQIVETPAGRALAFNADAEGHGPAFRTPWIAVQENQAYEFSFRYKVENAQPHTRYNLSFYSWINFQGEEGAKIPRIAGGKSNAHDTDGWQTYKATLNIPAGARRANLDIRNGSTVPYSLAIDDIRIAPAPLPLVTTIHTAAGNQVSLQAQGEHIRRFDLGPADSPVWQGFELLSPEVKYDAQQGYGFTRLARPRAFDRVRPEDLSRDFIAAAQASLRIDLPDGDYDVWLLTGDSMVGSVVYALYFNQRFTINQEVVLRRNDSPIDFFQNEYLQHYNSVWHPGMSYYDTFIAPRFETHQFPATVTDGKLQLEWENLPVAAVIVSPQSQHQAMQREWEQIHIQRQRATQIEETPGPDEPIPAVTSEESTRGYVLFRRSADEAIYPTSRPRPEERIEALQAFAAQGQTQPVHFSLLPIKDLGRVAVRPTALRSKAGEIPSDAITVRVARYIFQEANRARHVKAAYTYQIAPFPLDQREYVPAPVGITWTWWADVQIPADTRPGIYEGALLISPEAGESFELPLTLRVLPFQLDPLPIAQGYYYFPTEPWYSAFWGANLMGAAYRNDPAIRQLIIEHERQELAFMKSLGLNSVAFGDDLRMDVEYVDGEVRLKPDDRFTLWMDLYTEAGMGPMPFYGFQPIGASNRLGAWFPELKEPFTDPWNQAYRSLVQNIEKIGQERGWPEILWYTTDERSNHGEEGAKQGKQLAQVLEGMEGIRTIASMNGPWEHIMVPHLDISMPNIAFPITPETVQMIEDAGSELWLYNCGDERITLGLYPWRLDAGGRFQWHYRSMVADPWDDLDASYGDSAYTISLPGPDGPVPTRQAMIVRAAIDDHRYAVTLERMIEAHRNDPARQNAVARAEQFLEDLRNRIPVDVRTLIGFQVDPRAASAAVGGEFKNTDALDRVRWAMAQFIVDLQGND